MPRSQHSACYRVDQLGQVAGHRGVGVVGGKGPVDRIVQQDVAAGEGARERAEHRAGGAVAGIPRHRERRLDRFCEKARDVSAGNVGLRRLARAACAIAAGGGGLRQRLDVGAEERPPAQHHLDPVVVRRIVRAGDHHAAVARALVNGEVEHRGGTQADAEHVGAGVREALDQAILQARRAQPAIAPDADQRRPIGGRPAPRDGGEAPADGNHVGRAQRLADDPPDVVRAEDRRIERASRAHGEAAILRRKDRRSCLSSGLSSAQATVAWR